MSFPVYFTGLLWFQKKIFKRKYFYEQTVWFFSSFREYNFTTFSSFLCLRSGHKNNFSQKNMNGKNMYLFLAKLLKKLVSILAICPFLLAGRRKGWGLRGWQSHKMEGVWVYSWPKGTRLPYNQGHLLGLLHEQK